MLVMLLSPLLSALAAWIPAMMAAQQDPAVVLREE
jgi:ABC-type lipoprotein release transport system permease subunit